LAYELMKDPAFKKSFDEARVELRHVLGYSANP
jgi:hypothetical protein